jgi:hypothetical protein
MTTLWVGVRRLSRRRGLNGDDGITLIESVVALLIAAGLFLSLAAASMAGVKATLNGRANQQVGDFLSQQLEKSRAMGYSSLAMRASDLSTDPAVTTCGSTKCYGGEQLVLNDLGSVYPHVQTVALTQANNITMTLSTYITRPTDAFGADYKRVTVVASWRTYGQTHTRTMSTMMTETQRGLPLPIFKVEVIGNAALTVNPGATVTYVMRVSNQGARDRFNMTKSDSLTWSFYYDVNNNGSYTAGIDTAVTDTNADGQLDTGLMEPNSTATILALRTIPGSAVAGTEDTTFTFTSVAQPAAAGAVKTVAVTTTIVIGAVTGTATPTTSAPATTTPPASSDCAAASVPTASAGSGNTIYQYYLKSGATDPLTMARAPGYTPTSTVAFTKTLAVGGNQRWTYTVSNPRPTFAASSTAATSLWVSTTAGSAVNLLVQVYSQNSGGTLLQSLGSVTLSTASFSCSGYEQLAGSMSIMSGTSQLPNNGQLVFKVTNNGASAVTLAYDASLTGSPSGRYQSYLEIGSNR